MTMPARSVPPRQSSGGHGPFRPPKACDIDWPAWTRLIDRKRRALVVTPAWPNWAYTDGTRASFRLDGIDVTDADVTAALTPGRPLRGRAARRVRAHLAVLRGIDRCRRRGGRPTAGDAVRWYTRVSDGLCNAAPSPADAGRLTDVLRRVNSPQRRFQPAVTGAARLHAELLADPLFLGFNGILARLLLHAHLAASGLPPVVFDPAHDAWPDPTPAVVTETLLRRLGQTFDRMTPADLAHGVRT